MTTIVVRPQAPAGNFAPSSVSKHRLLQPSFLQDLITLEAVRQPLPRTSSNGSHRSMGCCQTSVLPVTAPEPRRSSSSSHVKGPRFLAGMLALSAHHHCSPEIGCTAAAFAFAGAACFSRNTPNSRRAASNSALSIPLLLRIATPTGSKKDSLCGQLAH